MTSWFSLGAQYLKAKKMAQIATRYAHHIPLELIESGLPASRIAVFCYLSSRANKQRACWPSIQTIANAIGASLRTVKSCLADLVKAGFLSITKIASKVGPWLRNKYQLPDWGKGRASIGASSCTRTGASGCTLTKEPKNKTTSSRPELKKQSVSPAPRIQDDENLIQEKTVKSAKTCPVLTTYLQAARKRIAYHWQGHSLGCERVLIDLQRKGVTIETLIETIDRIGNNDKASKPITWRYFESLAITAQSALEAHTAPKSIKPLPRQAKTKAPASEAPKSATDKASITQGFAKLRASLGR